MRPPGRGVPHLLSQWDRVEARIRAHSRVVVFLDFDGTLVAIAPRPDQVRLTSASRGILERLARHPRSTLVVVSGRRRAELLRYIGIRGIHYFGLYGWERSAACSLPVSIHAALRRARIQLEHHLRAYPSAWIENKRSSFSVHLLDVPAAIQPRVRRQLRAWLKPFGRTLRAVENLRDVEILPRSIPGKGTAVRRFLAQVGFRHAFPLYFGDDLSDESGFVAVRRGASVHVGKGRATRARYSLRDPLEVAAALVKLEAALSDNGASKLA
jgi:trehalose 6-phosphate phosphatase